MRSSLYVLAVACPLSLVLSSCSMTSEHLQTIQQVLEEQVKGGNLTAAQFDAVMAALRGIAGGDWTPLVTKLLDGILTLAAGFLGIHYWRGPISARKGASPAD